MISAGSREICREPATKTLAVGILEGSLISVCLCSPSGPVILLCERQLTELREELVEAIKWDRLRRRDLHPQRFARGGVIDDEKAIR
jgi:hypothetical protein